MRAWYHESIRNNHAGQCNATNNGDSFTRFTLTDVKLLLLNFFHTLTLQIRNGSFARHSNNPHLLQSFRLF